MDTEHSTVSMRLMVILWTDTDNCGNSLLGQTAKSKATTEEWETSNMERMGQRVCANGQATGPWNINTCFVEHREWIGVARCIQVIDARLWEWSLSIMSLYLYLFVSAIFFLGYSRVCICLVHIIEIRILSRVIKFVFVHMLESVSEL